MIGFAVHVILATLFNARWWSTVAWEMMDEVFEGSYLLKLAAMSVTFAVCFASQSSLIGILVTFMAEKVYKDTPSFHEGKRPEYTTKERSNGNLLYFANVAIMQVFFSVAFDNPNEHPMMGKSPFANMRGICSIVPLAFDSCMLQYFMLAILIQAALILSDMLYTVTHVTQHKFKFLRIWSGHSYHHKFMYPLASCGPWLAPVDLVMSAVTAFLLPKEILMQYFGCRDLIMKLTGCSYEQSFVYDFVLYGYIHEMNDSDHCGKQLPTWSGFPLCPPLGFALGFHKSIPNHESHHNYSNCGFGLLGVGDWLLGTTGSPEEKRL